MTASAYDAGRMALMLNELRLPTIGGLWPDFAERSEKEGWQSSRLLGALHEHELAKRANRRIERYLAESHRDPTKTLATGFHPIGLHVKGSSLRCCVRAAFARIGHPWLQRSRNGLDACPAWVCRRF